MLVVHHHFRPGGVRRVIELAMPHLVAHWPSQVEAVVLATGEAPDPAWLRTFRWSVSPASVTVMVRPAFGYASEWGSDTGTLHQQLKEGLAHLLQETAGGDRLVWAHNLGLGRNLGLTRELTRSCHEARIPLIAHHHDWWFENRWQHFRGNRAPGIHSLGAVAQAVFAVSPWVRHAAINQADAIVLERHFPGLAGWLPNPVEPTAPPPPPQVRAARAWLRRELGDDAPVWLLPCRLLRRKNLAEALLLTRWLRPEAWLVTTGGVSSAEEQPYAETLATAAQEHGWRLRLGMLQGDETTKPSVPELLAASEAVLLTSLQEGFGLPFLEALAARRPLLARELPNIAPDLARFGFKFPQCYREIRVCPTLFDWHRERQRQARLFVEWKRLMPRAAAKLVEKPILPAASGKPCPVPFSRLTLIAQLEVLARPVEDSWERCAGLNPFLEVWRERTADGTLLTSHWPRSATRWLGGPAYARRFLGLVPPSIRKAPRAGTSQVAQAEFLRRKLRAGNLYPLLWGSCP